MARHLAACRAHPGLEAGSQRRPMRLAHGEALLWGQAVDGALDVEDGVDPPHRLGRERGLRRLGEVKELPPAVAQQPASVIGPGLRASWNKPLSPA